MSSAITRLYRAMSADWDAHAGLETCGWGAKHLSFAFAVPHDKQVMRGSNPLPPLRRRIIKRGEHVPQASDDRALAIRSLHVWAGRQTLENSRDT